jgi:hypothetical protein
VRTRLLPLVPCALLLFACRPDVFSVEVSGETTVQGDPSPLPGLLQVFPGIANFASLDFDQTQEFQNQGVTKDQVRSVTLEALRLRIVAPQSQDYGFLDELQFFAKAGDQEALIAEKFNISGQGLVPPNPVLELDLKDVELQPYVTAPSMAITTRGKGRLPPQDTRLEATVRLQVQVKVF